MMIDPHIQILAKCHVMSEGQPVNLEKCTLSRSIFYLYKTLFTNFMMIDPHIQILAKCHVMSCQRVNQSVWRNVPYPDQYFTLKNTCSPNFMMIDPHIQILAKCHVMSCHVMSEGHPVNLGKCTLSRLIFTLK